MHIRYTYNNHLNSPIVSYRHVRFFLYHYYFQANFIFFDIVFFFSIIYYRVLMLIFMKMFRLVCLIIELLLYIIQDIYRFIGGFIVAIMLYILFALGGIICKYSQASTIHNGEEIIGKNKFNMQRVYENFQQILEINEDYRLKTYRNHKGEPYTACYGFTYIYHRKATGIVEPCGTYLKDIILTPQFCEEQLRLVFDYNSQQLYKAFTLQDKRTGKKTNRYNQMTDMQLVGMLDIIHHNGRTGSMKVIEKMRIYLKNPTIANQLEVQKAIMQSLKKGSKTTQKGFNIRRDRIIKLMFT